MKTIKVCYVCVREKRWRKKIRKEKREREWSLWCEDLTHCSVLLLKLPGSAALSFFLNWMTSQSEHKGPHDIDFWIGLHDLSFWLKVGSRGIGLWISSLSKREWQAVGALLNMGDLRTDGCILSSKKKGTELEPHQGCFSVLERHWGGNPKTACWEEPR